MQYRVCHAQHILTTIIRGEKTTEKCLYYAHVMFSRAYARFLSFATWLVSGRFQNQNMNEKMCCIEAKES